MNVTIQIGRYIITPHPVPNGQTLIEVQRLDTLSHEGHPVGPTEIIDVDELFRGQEPWK